MSLAHLLQLLDKLFPVSLAVRIPGLFPCEVPGVQGEECPAGGASSAQPIPRVVAHGSSCAVELVVADRLSLSLS